MSSHTSFLITEPVAFGAEACTGEPPSPTSDDYKSMSAAARYTITPASLLRPDRPRDAEPSGYSDTAHADGSPLCGNVSVSDRITNSQCDGEGIDDACTTASSVDLDAASRRDRSCRSEGADIEAAPATTEAGARGRGFYHRAIIPSIGEGRAETSSRQVTAGLDPDIATIDLTLAEEGARLVDAIVQAGIEPHLTALGGFGESGA